MKIKAIYEYKYAYGDYDTYYRKCNIIGFTNDFVIVSLANGMIDTVKYDDIRIIDENYLPEIDINDEEAAKFFQLEKKYSYGTDYEKQYDKNKDKLTLIKCEKNKI